MVLEYASGTFIHKLIRGTAFTAREFGIVNTVYKPAIQEAERMSDSKALFFTRYQYREALHVQLKRREDKVIVLWEAVLKVQHSFSDWDTAERLPWIYAPLDGVYLQRTPVAKDGDLDSVTDYLSRTSNTVPDEVTQSQLQFTLPP